MKVSRVFVFLLFGTASVGSILACFMTPQEQVVSDVELVERTETIVLAKVEKAETIGGEDSISVRYHFRKIRDLKGDSDETFTIDGVSSAYGSPIENFDHHCEDSFWEGGGGRSWHDTDCVIYPTFAVGGIFLVFREEPYHRKSFELIVRTHGGEGSRDKWLNWSNKRPGHPTGPRSLTRLQVRRNDALHSLIRTPK